MYDLSCLGAVNEWLHASSGRGWRGFDAYVWMPKLNRKSRTLRNVIINRWPWRTCLYTKNYILCKKNFLLFSFEISTISSQISMHFFPLTIFTILTIFQRKTIPTLILLRQSTKSIAKSFQTKPSKILLLFVRIHKEKLFRLTT